MGRSRLIVHPIRRPWAVPLPARLTAHPPLDVEDPLTARLVVLVSGTGTTLQALLDASCEPEWGATVVAVGADRSGTGGEERARALGIPTFSLSVRDYATREDWDAALTDEVDKHDPTLVVLAGFMKLVGKHFLDRFGGRVVNTHPALSPSFPGAHSVKDALEHGVKVTGASLFVVDDGVDTGPIVAQTPVSVLDDDTEQSLHERIKAAERVMLVDAVGRMAREGFSINGRKVTIP